MDPSTFLSHSGFACGVQMLGDESRGSAWTRAVLGLPANELHLCGDGSTLDLVKKLCKDTGEELQVGTHFYD